MAIRKSVLMMSNTGTKWNVVGEPIRGNAYFGYTDGLHTVQIIYQNFVGGVGLQATLALDPRPEDWFWIRLNPNGDVHCPFLTFPTDFLEPTGANGGDTGSIATTFIGNFVYIRAVVTRDYIQPPPPVIVKAGMVPLTTPMHPRKHKDCCDGTYEPPAASNLPWETWQWGNVDKVMLSL